MERKVTLESYFGDYRQRLNNLLDLVDVDDLEKVVTSMITAFKNGKTVYVCGNGGSAATASHIQADFSFFVRYFTKFRPKVKALTDNTPIITAVGNDTSFNDIFVEQLNGHFEEGDVIICISASGNSENVTV
jgi:D-sedoheptulose 7-phosphate isomerase